MVSVFTSGGRLGEHEISVGNHDAKRSGFQLIECSPNLPPDVNTETILHFFYKITNKRGTKTVFTYAHVKWFYGQSERAYYLNYFIKDILSHIDRFRNETPKRNMIYFRLQLSKLSLINAAPIYRHINFRHASTLCLWRRYTSFKRVRIV